MTDIWERSDNVLLCTLSHIIGSPLSDDQWSQSQATLPLSFGCFGICSAKNTMGAARAVALHMWHSTAADLFGLHDTAHFTFPDQPALFTALTSAVGPNVEPLNSWIRDRRLTPQSGLHSKQHWWTEQFFLSSKECLMVDSLPDEVAEVSGQLRVVTK